jgi:predicted nucleic acid-binding protein
LTLCQVTTISSGTIVAIDANLFVYHFTGHQPAATDLRQSLRWRTDYGLLTNDSLLAATLDHHGIRTLATANWAFLPTPFRVWLFSVSEGRSPVREFCAFGLRNPDTEGWR